MRSILIALFLFISTSVVASRPIPRIEKYVFKDGKWYFEDNYGNSSKEVIGIDAATFEVIVKNYDRAFTTFNCTDNAIIKDKNGTYRIERKQDGTFSIIPVQAE